MFKKAKFQDIVIFGINLLFYITFFFIDGVLTSPDTQSYVTNHYSREPLYPTFLALFRYVFGVNNYFTVVIFVQCILAAIAAWWLTVVIARQYKLDKLSVSVIISLQFAVVLLCRFLAVRKATYCNEICSEGLAIPLFLFFITSLLIFIWEKRYSSLLACMVFAVCLISVRKQMYITFIIMIVIYLSLFIVKQISFKKFLISLISVLGVLLLTIGIDYLYNFCVRGTWMRHTADSAAMAVTVLYCSDSEDSEYFQNPEMEELIHSILKIAEERGDTYISASGNRLEQYDHYANHFDAIGYGIVNDSYYDYLDTNFTLTQSEREEKVGELNNEVIAVLLPVNWKRVVKVTFNNMVAGLCNTVSKASNAFIWYNILFTLIYILLMIRCMYHKQNVPLVWFSFLVFLATAINVGAVGLMIFAQTRYMIYNMPFVYIAMYLMIRDFGQDMWKKKKHLS